MQQRGRGRILQLASLAAFQPTPNFAVYSASKSFVLSFTEALTQELRDSGVTVTALCPGAADTHFFITADAEDTKEGQASKADAKQVAQDGYHALMSGQARTISGMSNKLKAAFTNVLPDTWLTTMAESQFEKQA